MNQQKNLNSLNGSLKTHHCGELSAQHVGAEVQICGWVNKVRDLGGLFFIDLRDKYGLVQLGFDQYEDDQHKLKELSLESVIHCTGVIQKRPDGAINKDMKTGEIELQVKKLKVLALADTVPFLPEGQVESTEDFKLKYRYIDLRTQRLQNMLSIRSKTVRDIRETLYQFDFTEVETPILFKTTPEGARDYVVPSRVHPGKVYALPQSPQTLKQLLMLGGTDRYFQICKCFRDEDLRADRQPEFTQIDIEASFVGQEFMQELALVLMRNAFEDQSLELVPMKHSQAIEDYGTDKPDVRFGLKHINVSELFKGAEFKAFADVVDQAGLVKAFFLEKELSSLTRKEIDLLKDIVKPGGAKGVASFKVENSELSGGISKFINDSMKTKFSELSQNKDGMWFLIADTDHHTVHHSLDILRRHFGRSLNLIDDKLIKLLWVYDFPLFDWDEENGNAVPAHHPFTSAKAEDLELYFNGKGKELLKVRANAYDLVCNGHEFASGSIRIFDQNEQRRMFELIGLEEEEINQKFGFFIEALKYGTPPHGGMAIGLDRLIMVKAGTENIRDVIAFPKTTSASDLMAGCPSKPSKEQFKELGITTIKEK